MAKTTAVKYCAFVSSSARDRRWSEWLCSALESYSIDKDLVGRRTFAGRVRESLQPIFRDSENLGADHSPSEQTRAALKTSRFLIVVCSPTAAKSRCVNEEIRCFKALRAVDNIIPVIVEGEPGDLERECLPPAMRFKIGSDGMLTWQQEEKEPIAIDARRGGDVPEVVEQKLVARLLGMSFDEIKQRAQRAGQRRKRMTAALPGIFLVFAFAITVSVAHAWRQLQTNMPTSLETATGMVNTVVGRAEKFRVARSVTLGFLGTAERLLDGLALLGPPTRELKYRRARMLIEFARNYEMLGNTKYHLARAEAAHRYMLELVAEDPTSIDWQNYLSVTYNEIGLALAAQGALKEAIARHVYSLAIMERIAASDGKNLDWQRNLSLTRFLLGGALFEQGRLDEALDSYRQSLVISERLCFSDTLNTDWQDDVADIYIAMGDVLRARGRFSDALKNYRASIVIFKRLTRMDPTGTFWQIRLAHGYEAIGSLFRQQRSYNKALRSYRDYLRIMKHVATAEPRNARWQQQLWKGYAQVADMLLELGAFEEAFKSYHDSLAVVERLAAVETENSERQRQLSISHLKIGQALEELEKLDAALESYQQSLNISKRLHAVDAHDINIRGDLVLLYKTIGDILDKQGSPADAIQSYRDGLVIAQTLANDDPAKVQNLLDTFDFQSRLAALGNDPDARWGLVAAGLRKLRSGTALTAPQEHWLHEVELQLKERSRVALVKEGPVSDPMNAMARAPVAAADPAGKRPPEPKILTAVPHIPVIAANPAAGVKAAPAPAPAASSKKSRTRSAQRRERDDSYYVRPRPRDYSYFVRRRDPYVYSRSPSYTSHNYYQGGYASPW